MKDKLVSSVRITRDYDKNTIKIFTHNLFHYIIRYQVKYQNNSVSTRHSKMGIKFYLKSV